MIIFFSEEKVLSLLRDVAKDEVLFVFSKTQSRFISETTFMIYRLL